MTIELAVTLAAIALGVGLGVFIGLLLHIWYSDDSLIEECNTISELRKENIRLQIKYSNSQAEKCRLESLSNDAASQNVYYRAKINNLEKDNTSLKLKLNELEEQYLRTLDHNAYLANEASQNRAENERLKKTQAEVLDYLKVYLRKRINMHKSASERDCAFYVAYSTVLSEITGLEAKHKSEDK